MANVKKLAIGQTEYDIVDASALHSGDNISELVNDSGYITGVTSSDVTNALGYTPYNSSNPNSYTSNVGTITEIIMNGVSMGTNGVVDLGTVITKQQSLSVGGKETFTSSNWIASGDIKVLSLNTKKPILGIYKQKSSDKFVQIFLVDVEVDINGNQELLSTTEFDGYVLTL